MQETWVRFLDWEDSLEKEMATHSSILAWRIPWTEETGGLQSMWSQESDTTKWLSLSLILGAELPRLPACISYKIYINNSVSCLSLYPSLNSFCTETQWTWASVSQDIRWVILMKRLWVWVPSRVFVQVWVPAHGVKFQFEVNNFSLMKMERRKTEWLVYHLVWTNSDF